MPAPPQRNGINPDDPEEDGDRQHDVNIAHGLGSASQMPFYNLKYISIAAKFSATMTVQPACAGRSRRSRATGMAAGTRLGGAPQLP